MSKTLQDRVRQRLDALNMTPEAASKASGAGRDFVRKLLSRADSSPRSVNLDRLAVVLAVDPAWLLRGDEPPAVNQQGDLHPVLPVYGSAAGATAGALVLSPEPVEYIRMPPGLATVKDAYALIVRGSSMEPRYFAGDFLYVHPHRPVRPGDHVIIQTRRDHIQSETWVKRYKGEDKDSVIAEQYNPAATIRFKRDNVAAIHRILNVNELFGE